ncbi:C6 zinc finger domain-containing protein [Fusarium austroafricanum]|uniref:C6 zinc finger domain-containing protein n=1 Tax=Fusarium austroafricanum TaxID=2364996 RepID=A0A8H4K781_9HYPO|nr:C6 zinc finger domain-containing protein [Fusarium austroafricanum]
MEKIYARATETSRRRARTGCTTCSCEGYGIWGGGHTNTATLLYHDPSHISVSLFPLSLFPALSSQQQNEAFNHFQSYLKSKIPGIFKSGFWNKLVLQASVQEPAVLHSVVALAAYQIGNERLSLKAYNQAISDLCQHLKCDTKYAIRVTLIACMLFICLELMKGSRNTSDVHLQNGLRLLKHLQNLTTGQPAASTRNIITLSQRPETSDDCIVEAFTRLNVQSALFGQGANFLYELGKDHRKEASRHCTGSNFSTVAEARQHLDLLINGVLRLSDQADSLTVEGMKITSSLRRRRRSLESSLDHWMDAFQSSPFQGDSDVSGDIQTRFGMAVLRIYHTMIKIMVATCLRGKDEMIYDRYMPDFASLLQQVWNLWAEANAKFGQIHHKNSFTADMGYIPPLYYTSLRCRDPNLRRIAIDLLAKSPHVEGAWDGQLASAIVSRVMELEEGHIYEGYELKAGVMSPMEMTASLLPIIPAAARFNSIMID